MWSPSLLLLLMLLVSCSREVPPDKPRDESARHEPEKRGEQEVRLARVGTGELGLSRGEELARELGVSLRTAAGLWIDSRLVVREAGALGFTCSSEEKTLDCARGILETMFSRQTLCGNISAAMVDQAYEILYQPDWLQEHYRGELAEVRCCDPGACDSKDAQTCLQRLDLLSPDLSRVAGEWARTGTFKPSPELESAGLVTREFSISFWPDRGPEDQPGLTSWPEVLLFNLTQLPVGEVSSVIRSPVGLHVLKLQAFKPQRSKEDPEVRSELEQGICEELTTRAREQYLKDLRSGGDWELVEPALEAGRRSE